MEKITVLLNDIIKLADVPAFLSLILHIQHKEDVGGLDEFLGDNFPSIETHPHQPKRPL